VNSPLRAGIEGAIRIKHYYSHRLVTFLCVCVCVIVQVQGGVTEYEAFAYILSPFTQFSLTASKES